MSLVQRTRRLASDLHEIEDDFALSVVAGLSEPQKSLPCRYFYDAQGSVLFEEITRLPEYYLTRTEIGILTKHADEITEGIGADGVLVEFGSGSSTKTEILLDRIAHQASYVAIDVSKTALAEARARLSNRYRNLDITTIAADFSKLTTLSPELASRPKIGFFPGSTIGNLVPSDAKELLSSFGNILGDGGSLIIGVDLKKDPGELVMAYNDSSGVTAAFNLNLLTRINREFDANFEKTAFRHEAVFNPL